MLNAELEMLNGRRRRSLSAFLILNSAFSIHLLTSVLMPLSLFSGAALAHANSPLRRLVVLEELSPDVLAGVDPRDDGVDDAGGAVDDVERRVEAVLLDLPRGDHRGILVGHPPGVD